jgi:YQGE family putative transporter
MDKKKMLKHFIVTISLFMAASVLSDAFVNIYLWRLKADYFPITMYMLACYATVPVVFYLCGYIGMKIDRTAIYILGIFCYVAFYFMVLIFREHITEHVLLWGFIKGLAMGFYWFGYHILTFDFTTTHDRDSFYANTSIISGAASLAGPMIAGFIITAFPSFSGYYIIFACSAVLFITSAAMSYSMKSTPIKKPYKIEDLVFSNDIKWRNTMIAYFFLSGRDAISLFLISILVFKSTGNEFTLGKYSMMVAFSTISTAYILGKFSRPSTRDGFVLAGAVLSFLMSFLLIYRINIYTLLAYGIIGALADYLVRIPISAHALDVISLDANANERKMEYIVARDVPVAIGRITMLCVFITFLRYMPVAGIKAIILLISLFPFGVYFFMRNKKRIK